MKQAKKCDICGFDNPVGHLYCGRCGNGLGSTEYKSSTALSIEGERRQVTIIFADVSGFTALNDAAKTPADVERVVGLINHLLQELSEAIYEYDGYIDKYIGDEIMAIFGAPKAHENDPELALRAVLAMEERLRKFNKNPPMPLPKPLGIHGGINTGTVIAGMVGTDRKRSYTVMGDAVNVAARLEGVSERGEFLVSEATYNLTQRFFVFEEREPVSVKGKSKPLTIYQIKSARERPIQGPKREAPLIGREYEIDTLKKLYDKLSSKREGSIVVISGDAGLGKSRLVRDFTQAVSHPLAKGMEVESHPLWLFGRGLSYRQSFANRLFVEIIHSYLGIVGDAEDTLVKMRLEAMGQELFGTRQVEVVPYLETLLGLTLNAESSERLPLNDPQALQQRMFIAVGEWVEALAKRRPLVMVFEDLHWADPSSVALIEYLFNLTLRHSLLLVCVTRFERGTAFWKVKTTNAIDYKDNYQEITLWPLTADESRQVMVKLLDIEHLPADMENLLLSRAEGNPLFLEEVLRSLIEEGAIKYQAAQWEIIRSVTEMNIPNTLQGVLTARIDRLEESVKRVLQVAAVIGRVFPRYVLAPIVNQKDEILNKALEQLEAAELIERTRQPQPEYMFKHVLTYETAYNSMLLQQRKVIHRQIADHMARLYWQLGEEFASHVAEHYIKSEVWSRAFRYLKRAAEAAIQSFANREAVEFYTRALEVAEQVPPAELDPTALLDVYYGRARTQARLGEPQKAIQDYEAMLHKAKEQHNDSAQLRALNGIGGLYASHYDFYSASELFQEALQVARRIGDKQGMAETLNQLGNFYYTMGDLPQATKYHEEARGISMEIRNEVQRIEAEDGLAKILLEQGETAASLERYEEIIKARRRLGYRNGLIQSLSTMLKAQIFIADYQKGDEIFDEIQQLHQKTGDFYLASMIKYYQSFGQIYRGELGQAVRNLKEGLQMARDQKQKGGEVLGLAWLGSYYLTLGLENEGFEQIKESCRLALELGSPLYILRAKTSLGAAYRHLNMIAEAISELENLYTVSKKMGFAIDSVMILYQLIRAYINAKQLDQAKTVLAELVFLAELNNIQEFIIRAQWLCSLIEVQEKQYDAALQTLIHASQLAEKVDSRLSQYLIQIQKARLYHANDNQAAERDALNYAQKLQRKLVDNLTDEAMRAAFLNNDYARYLQEIG